MLDWFNQLFNASNLIPHGFCLQWNPALLWTIAGSDLLIALSYFSIPIAVWFFAHKRPDISHRWLFKLFAFFIVSCGLTHLISVLNIWSPHYGLDATLKILTAILSLSTAIVLWKVMPNALKAPSLKQLDEAHRMLLSANTNLENNIKKRTLELQESNQKLKLALDQSLQFKEALEQIQNPVFIKDHKGQFIFANKASSKILDITIEEVSGEKHIKNYSADTSKTVHLLEEKVSKTRQSASEEIVIKNEDGSRSYFLITKSPIIDHDHQDELLALCTVASDITEQKNNAVRLELASQVYHSIDEGVMIVDGDRNILAVNPAFTRMTGYEEYEVIGKNPRILQSGIHKDDFYRKMHQSLEVDDYWEGEIWNRKKDGSIYVEYMAIKTIRDDQRKISKFISIFSDITLKKKSEEVIWKQANFDSLTGLPNRNSYYERLNLEIKKSKRSKLPFALILIDLDHFKEVNDSLGHEMGDLLLIEAAKRMTGTLRSTDLISRIGGDEFIILLPEIKALESAELVAKNILNLLSKPYKLEEDSVYVSASIGIAFYPMDAADGIELFKNADQAMYAAKSAGRNRIHYFTSDLQEKSDKRLRTINELHQAITKQEFELYFQPIVDLTSNKIYKAESLIRWHNPQLGIVSPSEFIEIAEDTKQIIRIGDWAFKQAALYVATLRKKYAKNFQLSINKSPIQFRENNNNHLAWFEFLKKHDVPCDAIAVEITEGLLLSTDPNTLGQLLSFRDRGIQVSLDDFGTGYSSLAYLKKFDIDYIKIDQSFTKNIIQGSEDLILSEAIIVMAHKLNIKVIAEGVETQEQLDLLKSIGCDYGQGYYWSEPLPKKDFEKFLSNFEADR